MVSETAGRARRHDHQVKAVYFNIFYMRITQGEAIIDEIRGELDGYLRMESDEVEPVTSPA